MASQPPLSQPALRVLLVTDDESAGQLVTSLAREEGDRCEVVSTVADALTSASLGLDLAIVDLAAEGGAALALPHHLASSFPNAVVHVLVDEAHVVQGADALSLGAESILVAPLSGDAVVRVLGDCRARRLRTREVTTLKTKLSLERRRLEVYDRMVRFARGASHTDAVRAIVEGVAALSGAGGVALYAAFEGQGECVRLAAQGSASDLPATCPPADLSRLVQVRQARVLPLSAGQGEIGLLVLDRAPPAPEPEVAAVADLATAMLLLVDRQEAPSGAPARVLPSRYFRDVAERLLTVARRHERRASVLVVTHGAASSRRDDLTREVSESVRTTDALSVADEGDVLVFLPETGGLGAQTCRRRVLAHLLGERRHRGRRTSEPRSRAALGAGTATFPHDGENIKDLIALARARARDEARSAVHALALDVISLPEMVDALIARPTVDASPRSPCPLDLPLPTLFALVSHACRAAQRGGEVVVTTTLRSGLGGFAAAARQVTTPRVLDARGQAGCEDLEVVVVEGEHGAWLCCGRVVGERFRGVHAADRLLGDLLCARLLAARSGDAG